jgi:hypothetical protein
MKEHIENHKRADENIQQLVKRSIKNYPVNKQKQLLDDAYRLIGLMESEILTKGPYSGEKLNLASTLTGLSKERILEIIKKSKESYVHQESQTKNL